MVSLEMHEQQLISVHARDQSSQPQNKQEALTEGSPVCLKSFAEAPCPSCGCPLPSSI